MTRALNIEVTLSSRSGPPLPPKYWSRGPLQASHPWLPAERTTSLRPPQEAPSPCRIVKAHCRKDVLWQPWIQFLLLSKAFGNFCAC